MKVKTSALVTAVIALPLTGLLLAAKPPQDTHAARVARGKYLVGFAGCNDCHTPHIMGPHGPEIDPKRLLSGHPQDANLPAPPVLAPGPWFAATAGETAWAGPWGISYTANLTPDVNTGIGIWTEEMFIRTLRTGKHMSAGRDLLPPMPWQDIATLNDEDLKSIFAYLRSIPPVSNRVPDPVPPSGPRNFE